MSLHTFSYTSAHTLDFSDLDVLFYASANIACRELFALPKKQSELVELPFRLLIYFARARMDRTP